MPVLTGEQFEEAVRNYIRFEHIGLYQLLDGFYKEGMLDKAKMLKKEISEKNKTLGLTHSGSVYTPSVGVIKVDLGTLKSKRIL